MRLFAPIAKIDETQRLVFGYASTEMLDSQGEIVRKEAIEAALPDYMRFANIREMHQPSAVGVTREAELDDKGLHLAAKIVDDEAWHKVVEGVYKGFSIGGRVTKRDPDAKHVITGVDLLEISLVLGHSLPKAFCDQRRDNSNRARSPLFRDDRRSILAAQLRRRTQSLPASLSIVVPAGNRGRAGRRKDGFVHDAKSHRQRRTVGICDSIAADDGDANNHDLQSCQRQRKLERPYRVGRRHGEHRPGNNRRR
jgi:phage head maturation protease